MLRILKQSLPVARMGQRIRHYSDLTNSPQDVLFKVENTARIITLNRPKKLNALNTNMVEQITLRLLEYEKSDATNLIIINSNNSPRSFCSGGDVSKAAENVINGKTNEAIDFFYKEYSLNNLLSMYSKPIVSYMDGITMGGGVGLSCHGSFRVATENTRIAMPEMDIGYFPDVGTSFLLPKLDGKLGDYLSYTGESVYGIDSLIAGFATHYVPSIRLNELTKRLSTLNVPLNSNGIRDTSNKNITNITEEMKEFFAIVNNAIEEFTDPIPKGHEFFLNNEQRNFIDEVFNKEYIEEVFEQLSKIIKNDESLIDENLKKFAEKVFSNLNKKSFVSLKLANELLRNGKKYNNTFAFTQDLILSQNMLLNPSTNDFVEGVSKKLITKTGNPEFKYKSFQELPVSNLQKLLNDKENLLYNSLIQFPNITGNTYKTYPFNMGLPSELEIKNYIIGEDGSGRDYAPTKSEVVKKFLNKYSNKVGVNWKVKNVLERKTKQHEFGEDYVNWVE